MRSADGAAWTWDRTALFRSVFADRFIVKVALASGLAWAFGTLAGQPRPIFAAIVPILVIRVGASETLRGSVGRILGVLAGVGIGLLALQIASPAAVLVGVVVGIALVVDRLASRLPYFSLETRNQSAISALLMMSVGTSVTGYAVRRVWETAIGAAIAFAIEAMDDEVVARWHRGAPT